MGFWRSINSTGLSAQNNSIDAQIKSITTQMSKVANNKENNNKELLVMYISRIKNILFDVNLKINSSDARSIACEIMNSSENPEKISIDHNQVIKMAIKLLNPEDREDNETEMTSSEKKEKMVFTLEENTKKIEEFIEENSIKNSKEFLNNQNEIIDLEIQNINFKKMTEKNKENIEKLKKEQEYGLIELKKDLITYIMGNDEIVVSLKKEPRTKNKFSIDISYIPKYNIFIKNITKENTTNQLKFYESRIYKDDNHFNQVNLTGDEVSNLIKLNLSNFFCKKLLDMYRSDRYPKEMSYSLPFRIESDKKYLYFHRNPVFFSAFKNYISSDNPYNNAESILNLFLENNLNIIFGNVYDNCVENNLELQRKFDKLKEFYDTTKNIIKLKTTNNTEIIELPKEKNSNYSFNYELLLKNYNLNSMETNLVDYYGNIKKWIDDLSKEISSVTNVYKDVFSTINNYQTKQRNLSFSDNIAFEDRKIIFDRYLIGNPEEFYKTLFSIGEKAKDYELKLNDATNNFDFKILTDLEREERPSFSLIAKNTGEQWNNYAKQLNEVSENLPRITKTIEIHEREIRDWNLLLQRKENYVLKEDIDKTILESWFNEWQEEYIVLSKKVNNLLESYLRNVVDENSFIFILDELYNFRSNIDKIFEEEVIGAHYKFAFVPGGELQESLERKSLKFKFIIQSIDNIEKLIFSIDNPITRRFLIKWNNMWFSNEIFENINRFSSSDYDEVMIALNRDFIKMKEDNFKEFYNDVDAYINHKKEREKEYNSLIFKMRKEIAKQYANKQV